MTEKYRVNDIEKGWHPDGYRIDKTASPIYFYTHWDVDDQGQWRNCRPVDFDVFPRDGWIRCDGFDWDKDMESS